MIHARHTQETGDLDVHRTNVGGESVDLGGFRQYVHRRESNRRVEWAMELDTSSFTDRLAELFAPVKQVAMLLNLGIGLDDQDHPLPESMPEIHTYELLADGQSLLRMSRRRDSKLQLDRLDHEHPVFREVIKAMVLLFTTTETIHPEDFEGLDEAIAHAIRQGCDSRDLYEQSVTWAEDMKVDGSLLEVVRGPAESPPADYVRHQGWVLTAFRNALWQLLHATNLEEAVVDTVMRGGDTDTNAAICGAILGAVHGRDAVPHQWVDSLLNCRPAAGQPNVHRPRPECFWPVDALELAERLLKSGEAR
ncbi:ADP-ribosylglycohydrolase family protein [Desulfoglaeba alkanexedens ALDC]|uniref:ADP-ribosylglycohydrolase family protein n=2 Tax=Desulfoglaeba alkanexedens TaxID=361111 RepID=A0A4P8L612_9BACT|nr:ADP-ribosylglycohydrolase family protein [Desulfoglaeba alkanexedens ALDC]